MSDEAVEMRCNYKLHGKVMGDGTLEFKCSSSLCGAGPGVIVLHRFDSSTGNHLGTQIFRDTPVVRKEVEKHVVNAS